MKTIPKIELRKRVLNGIRWLNKNKKNWHKKTNLKKIDIQCYSDCIIGQLYGDLYANNKLGFGQLKSFGFILSRSDNYLDDRNWIKLADVWREEILKLRRK